MPPAWNTEKPDAIVVFFSSAIWMFVIGGTVARTACGSTTWPRSG